MKKLILLTYFLLITAIPLADTVQSTKTEARLLWVSRWMYSNEQDVRTIVRNAKTTGFNMLLFQVRGNATAFYKSFFEPMDEQIGGDTATWDPLSVAVDESKKQGIQIH